MRFAEFMEGNRPIVTMDFDHNLKFETGKPNISTIKQFKKLQEDYEMVIVTSRLETKNSIEEIKKFLEEYGLIAKRIIHTNKTDKLESIIQLESIMHFDDDENEIKRIKQFNEKNNTYIKTRYTFNESAWNEYLEILDKE